MQENWGQRKKAENMIQIGNPYKNKKEILAITTNINRPNFLVIIQLSSNLIRKLFQE